MCPECSLEEAVASLQSASLVNEDPVDSTSLHTTRSHTRQRACISKFRLSQNANNLYFRTSTSTLLFATSNNNFAPLQATMIHPTTNTKAAAGEKGKPPTLQTVVTTSKQDQAKINAEAEAAATTKEKPPVPSILRRITDMFADAGMAGGIEQYVYLALTAISMLTRAIAPPTPSRTRTPRT